MATAHPVPAWRSYLELVRPPNVATALADVLAGFAIAGPGPWQVLPWLLLATAALYGGGVMLNDVCDRALDARERPERPIPSGRVTARGAGLVATLLLALGVVSASRTSVTAGLVGLAIAVAVVTYDLWGKHRPLVGPVNMGLCRGLNLWLGMAAVPATLGSHGALGLLPLVYIAAVTAISRGEVSGGHPRTILLATAALGAVLTATVVLAVGAGITPAATAGGLALAALLGWRVLPPFLAAWQDPSAGTIRRAVGTGILSLVLLDGLIATAYAGIIYGLGVLVAARVAWYLARFFAVT